MKKFILILSWIGAVFSALIANIFAFIELRTVFSGDWKLAEAPVNSVFQYILRSLFFLLMLFNAVSVMIKLVNHKKLSLPALIFNASLIGGTAFTFSFYEWYLVILIMVANIITLLIRLRVEDKTDEEKVED